jgi:hypothetical protein
MLTGAPNKARGRSTIGIASVCLWDPVSQKRGLDTMIGDLNPQSDHLDP